MKKQAKTPSGRRIVAIATDDKVTCCECGKTIRGVVYAEPQPMGTLWPMWCKKCLPMVLPVVEVQS